MPIIFNYYDISIVHRPVLVHAYACCSTVCDSYSLFTLEITTTGDHTGNDDNKCHDDDKTNSCHHTIKLEGEREP